MTNQDIIDNFFDSYMKRDLDGVENVMEGEMSFSNPKISKPTDVLYFYRAMVPDYPHKIFPDSRNHFFLLMETLAMMPVAVNL